MDSEKTIDLAAAGFGEMIITDSIFGETNHIENRGTDRWTERGQTGSGLFCSGLRDMASQYGHILDPD